MTMDAIDEAMRLARESNGIVRQALNTPGPPNPTAELHLLRTLAQAVLSAPASCYAMEGPMRLARQWREMRYVPNQETYIS